VPAKAITDGDGFYLRVKSDGKSTAPTASWVFVHVTE